MGCRSQRSRERFFFFIRLGELDTLLGELIDAETPEETKPDELPDIEEIQEDLDAEINLPYPVDLCIELWKAWTDHGVPATVYLAQPRRWHQLIRLMNSRSNGVREARAAEKQERDYFNEHVRL